MSWLPAFGRRCEDVWNRSGADCGPKCITFQPVGLDRAGGKDKESGRGFESLGVWISSESQRHVEVFPKMSGWPKP